MQEKTKNFMPILQMYLGTPEADTSVRAASPNYLGIDVNTHETLE